MGIFTPKEQGENQGWNMDWDNGWSDWWGEIGEIRRLKKIKMFLPIIVSEQKT